ncbi:MAG: type II secretion system protein GspL [Pseudomonadota bacterium]
MPEPQVIAASAVSLFAVDLPIRNRRKRLMALPFALEERIAEPLEEVHVVAGPDGSGLAAVVAHTAMEQALQPALPGALLPEILAVPRPDEAGWHVWVVEGAAHVRAADGTGFALRADALPGVWKAAGQPEVVSFGETPDVAHRRHVGAAPTVEVRDLAFDLRQGPYRFQSGGWAETFARAGGMVAAGLLIAWACLLADRAALEGLVKAERARAELALQRVLPDVPVDRGVAVVQAALLPGEAGPDPFLALLARMSEALLGAEVSFRSLRYAGREGTLQVLLEAGSLEDLQEIERSLAAAGLQVTSGAASARDGGAEVLLTIRGARP